MDQWRQRALQWAEAQGITAVVPKPAPNAAAVGGVFASDPSMDFGRLSREEPAVVWRPGSEASLREVVRFLVAEGRSIVTRGTGHASGGQSLHAGGDVVSMESLTDIGEVGEDGAVWVQAGCLWQTLCYTLRRVQRRPVVLTNNWAVSVGGTLSVGGVGASSHRHGLQVDTVDAVRVLTLDGEVTEARRGEPLFDYVLAGRGQLGILVAAQIRTQACSWILLSRALKWSDWDGFEEDSRKLSADPAFELLVSRVRWDGTRRYRGAVGTFDVDAGPALAALSGLNGRLGPVETIDYYFEGTAEFADLGRTVPALEFSLPWPASRSLLLSFFERLEALGLGDCQPGGTRVCWWPGRATAPLGPFAPSGEQVLVALRPEVVPQQLEVWLPALDDISAEVVSAGGRIYSMSYGMRDVAKADPWLGAVAERWREHKKVYDPDGLLNTFR